MLIWKLHRSRLIKTIFIVSIVIISTIFYLSFKTIALQFSVTKDLYYLVYPDESIMCYKSKTDSLTDISEVKPERGKSIFFHETSCLEGKIKIAARQACAVESAAKMNPNFDVYLLYTSPGIIKYEGTTSDKFLKALQSYRNINIYNLNYENYTKGTPLEELYQSGKLEYSHYPRSHASDILRYLTLWKYGGIYLDLDVINIKSLEKLPPNYAGAESDNNVAAGVLSFGPTGDGHRLAKICVDELKEHFRGDDWGYNGPGVITRLLKNICGVEKAKNMLKKDCQGFKVYPVPAFYPIPWWNWTMYFEEMYNEQVLSMTKDSYAIHVWNKHSTKTKIKVNDNVPYTMFAKKYCPKVFLECDIYF